MSATLEMPSPTVNDRLAETTAKNAEASVVLDRAVPDATVALRAARPRAIAGRRHAKAARPLATTPVVPVRTRVRVTLRRPALHEPTIAVRRHRIARELHGRTLVTNRTLVTDVPAWRLAIVRPGEPVHPGPAN
jgi:hypothetical protein